uniref:ABC transporter domain-containing protein n=1 Tax=Timema tahoe TaxID=61484 RepID=A0A7R9NZZ5_9NEOP|nr:unnamed protein product [Timema tahoe]
MKCTQQGSNPDLPVFGSLVQHEINALDHADTEVGEMPNTRRPSPSYELSTMERRYSVPPAPNQGAPPNTSDTHHSPGARTQPGPGPGGPSASEDLHAWSIYRQNLNSDFTDSALGSSEKSPLPYGNFQLRESTVQSILTHPRYGPKSALGPNIYTYFMFMFCYRSALGANMYTYLKFGLPRVFPPSRGPRDGSSGYDSSDDGSPYLHRQGRNYLRSRSDPDFRNQPLHRPYTGHGPRPLPQPHVGPGWVRTKSNSEANLLSHEVYARHQDHRRSVHDLRVADLQQQSGRLTPSHINDSRHRTSNSSLVHNRRTTTREEAAMNGRLGSVAEAGYAPIPDHIEIGTAFKYPHLQVRGLEVESKSSKHMLLLQGISFEVHGGEIMAVMATAEEEGTGFLEALSGRSSHTGRIRGDVLLNGQLVHSHQLRDRVAYVESNSHLSPDLSVKQTLRFHHWLRRAGNDKAESTAGKIEVQDKIDTLIEDLGLGQVHDIKVSALTTSERRRLNVACHLLLNTDIVVLDQPTKGMDIFDTFFLVEFLRQWSGNSTLPLNAGLHGGRIVILTLHPPTYEIFTMLSRVALVSAGRLMFTGRRRDMLPYFALVQYPCPAYKNPSDYYLDLVTLDDLSAEAMLESSQRIEQLAETFRRHQEPLSDPGPPIALPYKIKRANCFSQMIALLM